MTFLEPRFRPLPLSSFLWWFSQVYEVVDRASSVLTAEL